MPFARLVPAVIGHPARNVHLVALLRFFGVLPHIATSKTSDQSSAFRKLAVEG
ncbi:hypothetical protein [Comamonas piscis]